MIKLDKYDKFYRMVGSPLITIHIDEFINDLKEMGEQISWNNVESFDTKF